MWYGESRTPRRACAVTFLRNSFPQKQLNSLRRCLQTPCNHLSGAFPAETAAKNFEIFEYSCNCLPCPTPRVRRNDFRRFTRRKSMKFPQGPHAVADRVGNKKIARKSDYTGFENAPSETPREPSETGRVRRFCGAARNRGSCASPAWSPAKTQALRDEST